MALGHLFVAIIVHVECGKDIHAVVVHVALMPLPVLVVGIGTNVGIAHIGGLDREAQQLADGVRICSAYHIRILRHTVLFHGTGQASHGDQCQVRTYLDIRNTKLQICRFAHTGHCADITIVGIAHSRICRLSGALQQLSLSASTSRTHQAPRILMTIAMLRTGNRHGSITQAKLPAHDIAFAQCPMRAANGAPTGAIVKADLHTALAQWLVSIWSWSSRTGQAHFHIAKIIVDIQLAGAQTQAEQQEQKRCYV